MNKYPVMILPVFSAFLLLAACASNVGHGHLKEDAEISSIKTGVSTRSEVMKILGSPSSESSFGNRTWYYVSTLKQTRSILPPRIIDQHTVEIAFNDSDVVASVKEYSLADSKNIEIATRSTPTEGQSLGFFEQILANLGRFNKAGDSTSNRHGSSNTGAPTGYPGR